MDGSASGNGARWLHGGATSPHRCEVVHHLYDFSSSMMGFRMFTLLVSTMQPFITISAATRNTHRKQHRHGTVLRGGHAGEGAAAATYTE